MDQSMMKELMEFLKADRAETRAHHEKMMSGLKRMNAKLDAWFGKTEVCLEEKKSTPKETQAVAEPKQVPDRATDEETSTGTEDRAGELRLVLRRRRQRKKRAQVDGEPRQKFAAFRGRFTRRAVPAMRKGHVRRGPGKRRCRSGIGRPGKASRTGKREESVERRTKNKVVQETPKGWTSERRRRTRPECDSGIRKLNKVSRTGKIGRIMKKDRLLDRKKTYIEAIRKSLCMEIAKLMIESSVGLREPGNGTLWKCRPPPKRKR